MEIKYNRRLSFKEATGKIDYTMTNDYMFRAILQTNEKVLCGLVGSLLHLKAEEIDAVTIENPIELGAAIDNKNYILDIKITLNNNTSLNLEMQVANRGDWTDRSLLYLCRRFDNLNKGRKYEEVRPAIHIGILDFTLFPDEPEFYATNKLMNIRSHKVFNDKFTLRVLSLKQIELATEEDKEWEIDAWAKLFSAKTWRELEMAAKNNDIFTSASETLYRLNADELIREQCQAREDYERHERTVKKRLAEQAEMLAEQAEMLEKQSKKLEEKDAQLENQNKQLKEKDSQLELYKKLLKENNIPY